MQRHAVSLRDHAQATAKHLGSLLDPIAGRRCQLSLDAVGRAFEPRSRSGRLASLAGQARFLAPADDLQEACFQCGPLAVLPHPFHQLAEAGPGAGSQGVSGVPEIMEMDGWQPGRFERGQLYPAIAIQEPSSAAS